MVFLPRDGDIMDAGKMIPVNIVHGAHYDEVAYNRLGLGVVQVVKILG